MSIIVKTSENYTGEKKEFFSADIEAAKAEIRSAYKSGDRSLVWTAYAEGWKEIGSGIMVGHGDDQLQDAECFSEAPAVFEKQFREFLGMV